MGSKGRMPPPHPRRPLPGPGMMHPDSFGPGMMHPDPYGPGIHPPPGGFPPFDMMPPPEIMEQKLATQHGEMQRLATENQRLAATHVSLRQELAAAQQELQRLQSVKNEKEHHIRGLVDKIGKMEVDLQAAEPVKLELQKARAEAQSLIASRQELISKVQQLTQDLQRTHLEVQQIPALTSELDGIRQEYHRCRATYDYEKKLYNDHLELLQAMEKNYLSMAREVEKLKADLANNANLERVAGPHHGAVSGYKESETAGQNAYEDGYNPQGRIPPTGSSVPYSGGAVAASPYSGGAPAAVSAVASPYGGGATTAGRTGYDTAQRVQGYDPSRVAGYDPGNVGTGGYVPQPRGPSSYDSSAARGSAIRPPLPQGQQVVALGSNVISPYGLATPPTRPVGGGGYEPQMQQQQQQQPPRGGNQSRR
ncbi:hypothetical protein MKW94_011804 [Papaver nudicaule]|uniref:Protein FLX-like 2 n=1 Tax=Papaver nudicaule TaxID=74823 RepID=A0AA41UXY9_PAPNU|nr:hypothetical protein [Papaver nudicaule]